MAKRPRTDLPTKPDRTCDRCFGAGWVGVPVEMPVDQLLGDKSVGEWKKERCPAGCNDGRTPR